MEIEQFYTINFGCINIQYITIPETFEIEDKTFPEGNRTLGVSGSSNMDTCCDEIEIKLESKYQNIEPFIIGISLDSAVILRNALTSIINMQT